MADTLDVLSNRVICTGIYCIKRFVIFLNILGIDFGFVGSFGGCSKSYSFITRPHIHCGTVCDAVHHGRFRFAAICSPQLGRKSVYLAILFHYCELILECFLVLYIKPRFFDHPGAWRKFGFGIMVLACMALPIVTLWYNSDVGASIMVFALLYAFQANNNPRKTSMRQIIIAAIVIEAVSVTIILNVESSNTYHQHKVLLLYFASLLVIIVSTVKADRASIQQLYEHFTAYCGDFINWFYVPCMGLPLSFIISMSLRLDFANHNARVQLYQDHSADSMMLEQVSAPEAKSPTKQLTAGIVIPSSIPIAFDCPYFLSTLLTWIFANTAIMQLLAHGWLPDFGRFVYSLYVLLCALPMAVLSVVGVSLVRGEARHMWTYDEHWNLEPVEEKAVRISEKVRELINFQEEHV
jgi:hypothetical protein